MDALAGAFAHYDFNNSTFYYLGESAIPAKMNRNSSNYPDGYQVADDSWINWVTKNQNTRFDWTGPMKGKGVQALGRMIANSGAFSACMTKRVFETVCRKKVGVKEQLEIDRISLVFKDSGFKIKVLFKLALLSDQCN